MALSGSHRSTRSTVGDMHAGEGGGAGAFPTRTHTLTRKLANASGPVEAVEEYAGPAEVPVDAAADAAPSRHAFPAFFGADGALFDVDYRPVPRAPVDASSAASADARDVFDVTALARGQPQAPPAAAQAFDAFPAPERFRSFEDFEAALVAWRARVVGTLGYALPPSVMGRHYFRPMVSIFYFIFQTFFFFN